jgi:ABC-type multidrug transport system ATPase subunit
VCVLGNNGAGKSTFLKLCAGLLSPTYGSIIFNHFSISDILKKKSHFSISWLPQQLRRAENFNVIEFLSLNNKDVRKFDPILEEFDLSFLRNKELSALSAGEWKRVQLGKIWLKTSALLCLDEPDSDLDVNYKIGLRDKCRRYAFENQAIVFIVTHDLDFAKEVANKICALSQGLLVWNSSAELFWKGNFLSKLYGLKRKTAHHSF